MTTNIALLNNRNWLIENSTSPKSVKIIGRPGTGVMDSNHYEYWKEEITYNENGFIVIDDWGGESDYLTYEETIEFIQNNFSVIEEIKVDDSESNDEKEAEVERQIEVAKYEFALEILNNSARLEEHFSRCLYCNHYVYKNSTFCNIYCERGYRKN